MTEMYDLAEKLFVQSYTTITSQDMCRREAARSIAAAQLFLETVEAHAMRGVKDDAAQ